MSPVRRVEQGAVPRARNTAGFENGFKPKPKSAAQEAFDARVTPLPKIPAGLTGQRLSDDVVLAFDGQTVALELTAPMMSKGGAPVLQVHEFEGRQDQMSFGKPTAVTITAAAVVIGAGQAQAIHDALMARWRAGHVVRVYGPMIGPGTQGLPCVFASEPAFGEDPDMTGGVLKRFNVALELVEWSPLLSLQQTAETLVAPGIARTKATWAGKGSSKRVRGGTSGRTVSEATGIRLGA